MVDVSAQGSCTVTPLNPTTLTTTNGALPNGTMNVMIQCSCTNDDGTVVSPVRWYYADGKRVAGDWHYQFDPTVPHFTRGSGNTLVIPTFNDSYDGTYKCGNRRGQTDDGPGSPNVSVTLTIKGKLMIITISNLCSTYHVSKVIML